MRNSKQNHNQFKQNSKSMRLLDEKKVYFKKLQQWQQLLAWKICRKHYIFPSNYLAFKHEFSKNCHFLNIRDLKYSLARIFFHAQHFFLFVDCKQGYSLMLKHLFLFGEERMQLFLHHRSPYSMGCVLNLGRQQPKRAGRTEPSGKTKTM